MSGFSVAHVLERLSDLRRYRVRVDFEDRYDVEGIVDLSERSGSLRLGLHGQDVAELVWVGDRARGHRIGVDRWLPIRDVPPHFVLPPDPGLVVRAAEGGVAEEGPDWVMWIRDAPLPLRDRAEEFCRTVLRPSREEEDTHRLQECAQRLRELRVDVELRLDRGDPSAMQVAIRASSDGRVLGRVSIRSTDTPPEEAPPVALRAAEPVPLSVLLMHLPSIGGWAQRDCHARWTQRALDLLKTVGDETGDDRYGDLYDKRWMPTCYDDTALGADPDGVKHHPIVNGAFYEDQTVPMPPFYNAWFASDAAYAVDPNHYWRQSGYWRDYNHFGGEGTGLDDRWYFDLRGCPPEADLVNGRYYSARDWGHGGSRMDESLNRLTFVRAIEQYNRCTFDGKRAAYLMLGHVVHLLQDQGQPDHARLVDHAGSSMHEVEAYSNYHYCEFLAAEAAAAAALACFGPWSFACAAAAFGTAEAACWASASSSEVGYERLIGPPVDGVSHWQLSMVDAAIDALGVVKRPSYDDYFKTMSDLAVSEASQRNLDSPLGCDTLVLIPPIPGADPGIDANDGQPGPYVELTQALVPQVVGLSAGLMQHFYDIVNHPPILERVVVVQWQPGARPLEFGVLARNAADHCIRYEAEWVMSAGQRTLKTTPNPQRLSLDRPAYVFLLFGPCKTGQVPEQGRRMNGVECRVSGRNLSTGAHFSDPIRLEEAIDPNLGHYYWGTFQPHNCAPDPYLVTLEVGAADSGAHLAGRPGAQLDSEPCSLARVEPDDPQYRWIDYTPGVDRHHAIMVSAASWQLETTPQQLTLGASRTRTGTFTLEMRERNLDCHEEQEYWVLTRCPVRWGLRSQVTDVASGSGYGPDEIGLAVDLRVGGDQSAVVTAGIPESGRRYRPGHYQLHVHYSVGEGGYHQSGNVSLELIVI